MFAGYGGASFALRKAGIPFETVGFSEIDKWAIECYKNNHGDIKNYGDAHNIKPDEVPDHDLLTGGFPCVLPDTLITTKRGMIPVEEVKVGDEVLTHKNRWKKVLKTMNQPSDHYYNVKISGSPNLRITGEHPVYSKKMIKVFDKNKRKGERVFSESTWIKTEELREDDFIAFGTWSDKYSSNEKKLTNSECWLIGRYMADGFIIDGKRKDRKNSYNNKTIFCIGKSKNEEFIEQCEKSGYHFTISEGRTATKHILSNKRFKDLCLECGKGASNKKIPFWIMNLPVNKLEKFLKGYISGDGSYSRGKFSASSVSKTLIYQIGQIVHRVYKTHYSIYKVKTPEKTVIEGRVVNQKDYWNIRFDVKSNKLDNYNFINNNIFARYNDKERVDGEFQVYNIEVEDDNSYVADNVIVHNCQSFSVAGRGEGELDPRGTLFWDIIRVACAKKPRYMLLENVKGLRRKKFRGTLNKMISELKRVGYDIILDSQGLPPVLNTKDYGVPQNRERVFFICKLGRWGFDEFKYPGKVTLNTFLKDVLEDKIPEKWLEELQALSELDPDDYYDDDTTVGEAYSELLGKIHDRKNVVDDKYYLSESHVKRLMESSDLPKGFSRLNPEVAGTQTSRMYANWKGNFVAGNTPDRVNKRQNGRRFKDDVEPMFTLNTQDRHGIASFNTRSEIINLNPKSVDGKQTVQQDRVYHPNGIMTSLNSTLNGRNNIIQLNNPKYSQQRVYSPEGIVCTISAGNLGGGKSPCKIVQINNPKHSNNRVYSGEGISQNLNTMAGGDRQPFICGENKILKTTYGKFQQDCYYDSNGIMGSIPAGTHGSTPHLTKTLLPDGLSVRKLTPRECFRLMGFLNDEINLEGLSNTQKYKLAGNGWEINLVSLILKGMNINGDET